MELRAGARRTSLFFACDHNSKITNREAGSVGPLPHAAQHLVLQPAIPAASLCSYVLTTNSVRCMIRPPCSTRACSRDDPEDGAGCGVPRPAARNRGVREARESARQALGPAPRGARCTRCGGNAADGSADPEPKNRHGGAPRGERPTSLDARRLASAWSAASWRAQPVLSAAPVRLSALRPPSGGGILFHDP